MKKRKYSVVLLNAQAQKPDWEIVKTKQETIASGLSWKDAKAVAETTFDNNKTKNPSADDILDRGWDVDGIFKYSNTFGDVFECSKYVGVWIVKDGTCLCI